MAKPALRAAAPLAGVPAPAGESAQKRAASLLAANRGPVAAPRRRWFAPRIKSKALSVFTRQVAILLKAGMPILRTLEVLIRQEKNKGFRKVLEDIADVIRSGGNVSEGMGAHPQIFDRLYVNMVKAGEAGGVMPTVFDRLAVFIEKAEKIKGRVKSAMIYPIIIVCVAVTIVAILMVVVVPKFEDIFSGLLKGQPLPALTQYLLNASNFMKSHYLIAFGGLVGAWFAFQAFSRTAFGRKVLDWLVIHSPVVGDLFLKAAIARFTRTFGTLLSSGVPILQALTITRDTSGNVHVANAINVVHDRVKEGDNVAKPLESTHIFPGMVTSMIEVGEETGALPDMLTRIAETYDEEVDTAVDGLTAVIEPIMIVFMAVMVGTIVIALFLPLVSIIENLK
jgi:type IV pilus assembly protein PilC